MKLNLSNKEDKEAAKKLIERCDKILKYGGIVEITIKDCRGNVKFNKTIKGDIQSQ